MDQVETLALEHLAIICIAFLDAKFICESGKMLGCPCRNGKQLAAFNMSVSLS